MACNSCKEKKDLARIRILAKKLGNINKEDIQIYKDYKGFNFEPINPDRTNVIEIIQWLAE